METLKRRIFDVLTGKITVSEFENWLYNCEEILENLNSNRFYFDVISLNYKSKKCIINLEKVVKDHVKNDFLEIVRIKKICSQIVEAKTFDETLTILQKAILNFDYESWFSILWEFYRFKDYFELAVDGIFNKSELLEEIKFYSIQTLEVINSSSNFDLISENLQGKIKPFKTKSVDQKKCFKSHIIPKKPTLKQKILAFFKKS